MVCADIRKTGYVTIRGRRIGLGRADPWHCDATTDPVARVHLPARIPLGFHGNWIADQ
jgi:carotenoid cleavage dioxygenase-like enzyme